MTEKEFRTERFVSNSEGVKITRPDQLQCATCANRIEGSAACTKFPEKKPAYVYLRKKDCPEYEKA